MSAQKTQQREPHGRLAHVTFIHSFIRLFIYKLQKSSEKPSGIFLIWLLQPKITFLALLGGRGEIMGREDGGGRRLPQIAKLAD